MNSKENTNIKIVDFTGAPKIVLGWARQQLFKLEKTTGAAAAAEKAISATVARVKVVEKSSKLPVQLPVRTKQEALEAHRILSQKQNFKQVVTWLVELCQTEYERDKTVNCNATIANALIGRFDGAYLFVCEFSGAGRKIKIDDIDQFVCNQTHKLPLTKVPKIREAHETALRACCELGIFTTQKKAYV